MGVKVNVGDVYTEIKRGTNAKGEWGLAIAKADRGTDKISISIANLDDVPEDTYAVQIDEILGVEITVKKVNDKFFKNFTARCKVTPVEGGASPINLEEGVPF